MLVSVLVRIVFVTQPCAVEVGTKRHVAGLVRGGCVIAARCLAADRRLTRDNALKSQVIVETKVATIIRGEEEARGTLSAQVVKGVRKEEPSNAVPMALWINGEERDFPRRACVATLNELLGKANLGCDGGEGNANLGLAGSPQCPGGSGVQMAAIPKGACGGGSLSGGGACRDDAGKAVLLVSFELDEIMNLCDRIATISKGKIVGTYAAGEVDERQIGMMMAGKSFEGVKS